MNGKHQLTPVGLERYKKELENLIKKERPRIIESLREARSQGDLSENADYD
ncbi:MAG: transcription elongation factor GreA, partial [Bacilli bacterium]